MRDKAYMEVPRLQCGSAEVTGALGRDGLLDLTLLQVVHVDVDTI